jgi:starch phosphorylase
MHPVATADDPAFAQRWQGVKFANKHQLATFIRARTGVGVDPDSLFDMQVKRIHEYKRQHLNVLHIVNLYRRLKASVARPRRAITWPS